MHLDPRRLVEVVGDVVARQSVPGLRGDLPPLAPQSRTASPKLFASGPEFAAAAVAVRRLGGDLTAADLAQTGVAGLLGSEERFDPQSVGPDVARYAARGDVERFDLVGLNACNFPEGPVPVAGWELVRLGQRGVRDLRCGVGGRYLRGGAEPGCQPDYQCARRAPPQAVTRR